MVSYATMHYSQKVTDVKNIHTIELIWFGEYNCLAQARIVLVFPVPGGP